MAMVDFISRLRNLGIKVWVEEGNLRYQAPKGVITQKLREELREKKQELIAFLQQINMETEAAKTTVLPGDRETVAELPLSYSQQSMWFIDQISKGNPVFNISNGLKIKGYLDCNLVNKALHTIVTRHESLRTTFKHHQGIPMQIIHPLPTVELPEIDLRQAGTANLEADLKERLTAEARRNFDLEQGPLYRFRLFRLKNDEFVLVFTTHHIISDAWSNLIIVKEFLRLYEAYRTGTPAGFESPLQFADYALWQKNWLEGEGSAARLEYYLSYWRKQLARPETLQLPLDHPRPKNQVYEGGFQPVRIEQSLTQKLRMLAQQVGATLFMTVLGVFQVLLYRYSGQEDILTGTVVANRNRKEFENGVGFFINTLVLRTNFEGNPGFLELLKQLQRTVLDAYQYQELPFDKLLEDLKPERDPGRTPLFQTMFILHSTPDLVFQLPGLELELVPVESNLAPFDFRLQLTESEAGLSGGFDYASALFEPGTVGRMAVHFQNLLAGIVANPEEPISQLPMLTAMERRRLLDEFNDTRADFPGDQLIHQLFEAEVARNPERIAVVFEDQSLTYGQLNVKANQLARFLTARGVGPETIAGLMLERSLEMIIGIMALAKAGAAYMPVDPLYPGDRIQYMLADSGATILLTHRKFSRVELPGGIARIFMEDSSLYQGEAANLDRRAGPQNLVYVIYTSGSTGKPKGTLIEHHSLVNRLHWMQQKYPIDSRDIILQKTPYTFDVSVWELFWWSIRGAQLCFLAPQAEKVPGAIAAAIEKYRISTLHFVPSMLSVFLDYLRETGEAGRVSSLRQVFASGEALTKSQVGSFQKIFGKYGTTLANLYGPTEATVDVSYYDCLPEADLETIPIGRPIDNIQLLVLNQAQQIQPIGVAGELWIGGEGLGRGYLNRPELTVEKFVPNLLVAEERAPQGIPIQSFYDKHSDSGVLFQTSDRAPQGTPLQSSYDKHSDSGVLFQTSDRAPQGTPLQSSYDKHSDSGVLFQTSDRAPQGTPLQSSYDNHSDSGVLFQTSNFKLQTSARFYKTGDLARWLPDGNIEFLGRIDHQVKIRGLRIELGEIETGLLKYPGIKEAVVIAKEDDWSGSRAGGDKYLCAYVVADLSTVDRPADQELSVQAMRAFLGNFLPEYMIPAYFIQLDEMPLTPNGKLDRKALTVTGKGPGPEREMNTGVVYEAPATELEIQICEVWQEVLGIGKIGVNDNFFHIGGNSLNLIKMAARLQQKAGRPIEPLILFQYSTIRSLVRFLTPGENPEDQEQEILLDIDNSFNLMDLILQGSKKEG